MDLRALLIAGGTVEGLGAVLIITPPQIGISKTLSISSGAAATPATSSTNAANSAVATVAPSAASGSFTGPAVFVNYGTVQVKITVTNGKITDAVALQAPSGRNDRYTKMAMPILHPQTLSAQSANIQGASGASYTSYGWVKSLQGALAQAGL